MLKVRKCTVKIAIGIGHLVGTLSDLSAGQL